eukprot:4919251-Pyramimonas_sp.AAC.1
MGQRVTPKKGLAVACLGPRHVGLKSQRSRLRRFLHPSALMPAPELTDFSGLEEADIEWLHGKL